MPRALIAGLGFVGRELALGLVRAGWQVWGIARSPTDAPPGVRTRIADLTEPATLADLPRSLDAVVHAAGPSGRDEAAYRAVYVEGLANLLAACPGAGRVVLVSSTGVFGQDDGSSIDEASPAEPTRPTGRILLEGEDLLAASVGCPVVLRLGGIYGPGRASLVDRLKGGDLPSPGGAIRYTGRIHRDDAARAIEHVLGLAEPDRLYLGVDDEPAARHEVLAWLAGRLGLPFEAWPDPSLPPTGKRCRNATLRASGFRFRFPTYREGYAGLL